MHKMILALALMASPANPAPPTRAAAPAPIAANGQAESVRRQRRNPSIDSPPPIFTVPTTNNSPSAAAESPSPPPAVRAQARADLASYILDSDYPDSEIGTHQQGRVTFQIRIGTNGRVIGCIVTGSSGTYAFDAATCRIMRSRARFTPARDAQGNPAEDAQTATIIWRLPPD